MNTKLTVLLLSFLILFLRYFTEISNTVTKSSFKNVKIRKPKQKSEMKPLTTKESKLPSAVSPSFPSKPVSKSDPADIQIPVFLTSSASPEFDTMDKQQPTEAAKPPSTMLPLIILSTTSDHTVVDKQHLPGTTSALDPLEAQKLSEPEISPSSRGPFHPTSEPDVVDNQEFTGAVPFLLIYVECTLIYTNVKRIRVRGVVFHYIR
ncbi:hypothetical protein scyTo_0003350 [Scyliorhinus torazame]|uniref:Uncharacterized protein n=1 Tax=Scyliorhinus torazame TaxID=75743 RepID=A0A401PME9_SCYTO|nr:hypothetical protein [Scyliorhinus torazame]